MNINVLKTSALGVTTALTLWSGTALAQAGDGWGYHHGWGGWGGHGAGMIFGPILFLLFIAAAAAVVIWVVRAMGGGANGLQGKHGGGASNAMGILEERLAKGEIDANEFAERKKALEGE